MKKPFNVAMIIPTGVGASIGGYGGDGMTLLSLFSAVADTVITHPNVANAACFQKLPGNTLYVEGLGLDRFFKGYWALRPVHRNRVGVIWDSGIEPAMRTLHDNTMAAVQTVYGVEIIGVDDTHEPLDINLHTEPSGRSAGVVANAHVMLDSAKRLIDSGATALAICGLMPVPEAENNTYKSGEGVDPIGGIEAMLSHLVVDTYGVPAAHAPVFSWEEATPVTDRAIDPKSAAEFIVPTFLPCVLTGLAKAPQFSRMNKKRADDMAIDDLSALIVPADSLGGLPVLACVKRGIPVIAVRQNTTINACDASLLGDSAHIYTCDTYLEAVGLVTALREGIHLPPHIRASDPVSSVNKRHNLTIGV